MLKILVLTGMTAAVLAYPPYQKVPVYYDAPYHSVKHDYHVPQPYDFGYETKDEFGGSQNRQESSDGHGGIKGSYGYTDPHGIYRHVDYVADEHGFRAKVRTNEPGTANQNPAAVGVHAEPPIPVHPPIHKVEPILEPYY